MPVPTTNTEFLDRVGKSGLVEAARLEEYTKGLEADGELLADPRKLAMRMIRDGLLSYFHSSMLLQGKSKGFQLGGYHVLEKLGSGGMGNVYLCQHAQLKHCVAIKVLPTDLSREHVSRERFKREARAISRLDHPNIVRAFELGKDRHLHFLVMEFVEGVSLTSLVQQKGPLWIDQACHCIRQAALGLQHAFESGLIHRDIKPDNLLVTPGGVVKILDMGLVLFQGDQDVELTARFEKDSVLGTADYLAPEQAIDSHNVDIRADIYSLGATFYYMLTGQTLFGEGTLAQKLLWHQMRAPRPVRELRPEVPEALERVVMKMLAKRRVDRYGTLGDVVEALAPWTQAPPPPSHAEPTQKLSPLALALLGSEIREVPEHQAILRAIGSFKTQAETPTERGSTTDVTLPPRPAIPPAVAEPLETVPAADVPVAPQRQRIDHHRPSIIAWVGMGAVIVFLLIVIGVLIAMLLKR
jgi:serine/threonine protein kinase